MSFKEVNNLRKNGDLESALKMAIADLHNERSEWTLSALFWVLRDLCKQYLEQKETTKALFYFQKLEAIFFQMSDCEEFATRAIETLRKSFTQNGDKISNLLAISKNGKEEEAYNEYLEINTKNPIPDNLHEDCGWIIFRYLKKNCANIGSLAARKALFNYLQLKNDRPSLLHSQILNLAMSVSEHYPDFKFLPFLELWGVDKFSNNDFRTSYFEGKTIDPLIERIIRRCFNLGYQLSEVVNAFGDNSAIVMKNYAKNYFFELSNYYKENNNDAFFTRSATYFNAINGADVESEFHSKILSLYLFKLPEDRNSDVISVLDKWGFQNFSQGDWIREQDPKDKNKEYPSLVEKVIKRYFAALKNQGLNTANEKYISLLKQAVNKYGDEQTERNLALVYAAKNEKEESLAIYRKLLLKLNLFYVWKELSDVADDLNLKISALCKAISSDAKDEFLGEAHLSLAKLLIDQKLFQEAKRELVTYKETYEKNKWRLKSDYINLSEKIAEGTIPTKDNKDFYNSHLKAAEEFIYSGLPEKYSVIDHINDKKKVYHCISSDGHGVIIPFDQISFKVGIKDFVKIRFIDKHKKDSPKEVIRKVISIKKANSDEAIKQFPQKGAVVDGVNDAKQLFHCVFGTNKDIIIKFTDTDLRPSVGDYVSIRYAFQKEPDKTYRKMLDISMLQDCNRTLTQTITGRIRINANKGHDFGFVDDYYVGKQFLFDIVDDDKVTIDVVYDGSKWRTYKLKKVED